jgi:hypothetical protein
VLDFERMTGSDHATSTIVCELLNLVAEEGKKVVVCGLQGNFEFHRRLASSGVFREAMVFELPDIDDALEYCEEALLSEQMAEYGTHLVVPLQDQPLLKGLSDREFEWLRHQVEKCCFGPGEVICQRGEEAEHVYLVEKGRVDIEMKPSGSAQEQKRRSRKVASFCGGAVIGEAAFFTRGLRSADVVAIDEVTVYRFDPGRLESEGDDAVLRGALSQIYRNLAHLEFERLSTANRVLMTMLN